MKARDPRDKYIQLSENGIIIVGNLLAQSISNSIESGKFKYRYKETTTTRTGRAKNPLSHRSRLVPSCVIPPAEIYSPTTFLLALNRCTRVLTRRADGEDKKRNCTPRKARRKKKSREIRGGADPRKIDLVTRTFLEALPPAVCGIIAARARPSISSEIAEFSLSGATAAAYM